MRPQVIYRGGRPRKAGAREPSGRLARGVAVLPPCTEQDGLALSAADYMPREITERGQVVGKTVQRVDPLDRVPVGMSGHCLDADEWQALREYQRRHEACTVSVKSPLDRTPPGGNGLEGVMDWLCKAIDARQRLRRGVNVPARLHLEAVIEGRAAYDLPLLRMAAKGLRAALVGEQKRA
jgi:hypothetical protein